MFTKYQKPENRHVHVVHNLQTTLSGRMYLSAVGAEVEVLLKRHEGIGLAVGNACRCPQPQKAVHLLASLQGGVVRVAGLYRDS